MRVDLAFSSTGLTAELPDGFNYRLLEARSAMPLADSADAIERALDNPVGSPPLRRSPRAERAPRLRYATSPARRRTNSPSRLS